MKRSHVLMVAVLCAAAIAVGVQIASNDAPVVGAENAVVDHRDFAALDAKRIADPTSPTRVVLRAPLPGKPDTDGLGIDAFIDKLAPRARQGDAVAAMRVYRAEQYCNFVEVVRRQGVALEANVDSEGPRTLAERMSKADPCAGVTPAQVRERFVFLDQAVRSGSPEAMIDYCVEGPDGFDPLELAAEDPRLITWKQNAATYLLQLAESGNADAWWLLSLNYWSGIIVPQDLRKTILYQTAMAISLNPDKNPYSLDYVIKGAKQLPASDVQNAIDEGTVLGKRFPAQRKRT